MKKWMKYLISITVFCFIFTVCEYLLTENINWKIVIGATIIYAIFYIIIDLICNKLLLKD